MIYKWSQPVSENQSGVPNPLDRTAALISSTQDRVIIDWLAKKAGGFFIKDPHAAQSNLMLFPATNQILQEFADMLAAIATAGADNSISIPEAKAVRHRWEQLKSITEGFVRCCEEGHFEKIREPLSPNDKK